MAEYIDKAKTLHRMKVDIKPPFYVVQNMPAEDVAPVRHGWWNIDGSCSECHGYDNRDPYGSAFCPHCGAKMDLEETECKES